MRIRTALIVVAILSVAAAGFADIDIHQEHSFNARPGAEVVVDVSFHGVEVTVRPGDTVDVTVDVEVKGSGNSAKNAANELQPVFLEKGNKLIIRSKRDKGFHWTSLSAKGHVTIVMPSGMDLTVDSSSGGAVLSGDFGDAEVSFDASSGSFKAQGAMRKLTCDTSSGSVRAELERPLEGFAADASSGSVHLTGGAHHATVDTSSGSISLAGLLGDAHLDSSSGSITAQWDAIPPGATVYADASSGSVTLRFPAGTVLAGSVDTGSGGISTDFPGRLEDDHLTLKGGTGAVQVSVDTSSGGVRLIEE